MEDFLSADIETDAVHHRLTNNGAISRPSSPAVEYNYQCYDCSLRFHSLAELGTHCTQKPWHCGEVCLKCSNSITVYTQIYPLKTVRLHSCRHALLKHQNTDLFFLSANIANQLSLVGDSLTCSVILCDECDIKFPQSCNGAYLFLNHSNTHSHNKISSCRKCSMPEFKVTTNTSLSYVVHYCTKEFKSVIANIPQI